MNTSFSGLCFNGFNMFNQKASISAKDVSVVMLTGCKNSISFVVVVVVFTSSFSYVKIIFRIILL